MIRVWANHILCGTVLASLAVAFVATERPTLADDAPVKQVTRWRRNHLPAYYSRVVTEDQREKINKIQEEYQTKIDALMTQVRSLKKERDEKISAVLTDEQKKKIEEAKTAKNAAKEPAKDADKEKATAPATSTPTTTTTTEPKPAK
jgi:Spy/CpxP family protein refolding chaperone